MKRHARKLWLLAAVYAVFIAPAWADGLPSLFFTPDEAAQIAKLNETSSNTLTMTSIHLGAVLYYGDSWTIWLQSRRVTSGAEIPGLQVLSVEPDAVHLTVNEGPDRPARAVTLKPYQTYEVATGQIIEGNP